MKLTPDQWKAVEKSLTYPHGRVELLCDGTTKVVAEVRRTKPLKFEVMVFIDGYWRGEWLNAEPARTEHRFLNPHERRMHSAKDVALYKKAFGVKRAREAAEKSFRWFSPTFPTGKSFRRRISSTCTDIRLVDCSEAEIERVQIKRAALEDELDKVAPKEPA
jgi:hypothetical protein